MKKQYKVDLHTHSIISHDGGITRNQYKTILEKGILDFIAITDHNETRFARAVQNELGERIIIGEEIKTIDGEIIGLFLTKTIPSGMSSENTIKEIKAQGGLVYVPHPFEKRRSGMQEEVLSEIVHDIDIVEIFNGRGFLRGKPEKSYDFALKSKLAVAASSDAHGLSGVGTSFSWVSKKPTAKLLVKSLKQGAVNTEYAKWYSLLSPGINKIKNKLFLGI